MPRKSQALRLQQATDLLAAYTEAGVTGTAFKFLTDMVTRMGRKKYPTTRQRNWLDKLIDEGVPTPKGDTELLAKMDAAVMYWTAANDRDWERNVLTDMRRVVFNDWKMSAKQAKLLNDILQRHQDDITGANVFVPTDDQRADLESLVKLHRGYSNQWINERPAVAKAVHKVADFLAGSGTIEEYHYNKLIKSMGAKLRRVNEQRFRCGDIAKFGPGQDVVTVMTDTYVDDRGWIVNDFLMPNGEIRTLDNNSCGKFRKRKGY